MIRFSRLWRAARSWSETDWIIYKAEMRDHRGWRRYVRNHKVAYRTLIREYATGAERPSDHGVIAEGGIICSMRP